MTYAFVADVPAPAQLYDALHAEITARTGSGADGLLVHLARTTDSGFSVLEVWASREHYDRFVADVLTPALERLSAGQAPAQRLPMEEFEPRGLVIPSASVLV